MIKNTTQSARKGQFSDTASGRHPKAEAVVAKALGVEQGTPITPGFEALVFKAEGPF